MGAWFFDKERFLAELHRNVEESLSDPDAKKVVQVTEASNTAVAKHLVTIVKFVCMAARKSHYDQEARIAELERRLGIRKEVPDPPAWIEGQRYAAGDLVMHADQMWHACAITYEQPGGPSRAWVAAARKDR